MSNCIDWSPEIQDEMKEPYLAGVDLGAAEAVVVGTHFGGVVGVVVG